MILNNNLVENFKINKVVNKHLRSVRYKKVKPNTKGSYSYCYYFGDYVILKNINKVNMTPEIKSSLISNFESKKTLVNYVKTKLGVNTPEILCSYCGKYHFYEIQEKAKGSVLSVFYPSTARVIINKSNSVLDSSSSKEDLESEQKISFAEQEEIGKGVFLYNINMQKQLKDCNQSLFDKFTRDFKILLSNGIAIDTSRSENFLFDSKNGFSFVDLEKSNGVVSNISDFTIAQMIYESFKDFTTYCQYMNENQVKIILKNMDAIYKKVYKSFERNQFVFTPEEKKQLQQKTTLSKDKIKNLGL